MISSHRGSHPTSNNIYKYKLYRSKDPWPRALFYKKRRYPTSEWLATWWVTISKLTFYCFLITSVLLIVLCLPAVRIVPSQEGSAPHHFLCIGHYPSLAPWPSMVSAAIRGCSW